MRLRQLLRDEGQTVPSIAYDGTVAEAIDRLAEQQTTALIVMKDGRPVGIFTERDVLRCCSGNRQRGFTEIGISDAMTNKLIVAKDDDAISPSLQMMLQTDIKHLPVCSEGKIIALLSLQTLVQQHIQALTEELVYLQDYVADLQNAGQD